MEKSVVKKVSPEAMHIECAELKMPDCFTKRFNVIIDFITKLVLNNLDFIPIDKW